MKTCPWRPPKEVSDDSQLETIQNHSRRFRAEICQAAAVWQKRNDLSSVAVAYEDICRPCCPVGYRIIDPFHLSSCPVLQDYPVSNFPSVSNLIIEALMMCNEWELESDLSGVAENWDNTCKNDRLWPVQKSYRVNKIFIVQPDFLDIYEDIIDLDIDTEFDIIPWLLKDVELFGFVNVPLIH
ncbi:hypothetical protein llap_8229 [Limosa lapponica baueri]|uniref:Uncharacterized protein n=1 Tax=Limosa lapponica baueri TaxID=1758121 RepID=A0A2I0U620_LIMLA|nr:hypothetical protein llap_8229 [Limosa lapponica baueri]